MFECAVYSGHVGGVALFGKDGVLLSMRAPHSGPHPLRLDVACMTKGREMGNGFIWTVFSGFGFCGGGLAGVLVSAIVRNSTGNMEPGLYALIGGLIGTVTGACIAGALLRSTHAQGLTRTP